mgnify:CR=1 FL=1
MMNLKTTKLWSNYAVLLLVFAFIAAQFMTVHIHLAEQHDHDGASHQHQSAVHTHDSVAQAIDTAHQENHENTIEFDSNFSLQKKDKQNSAPSALILTSIVQLPPASFRVDITHNIFTNTKLSYLSLSTTHPRAPPNVS